VEAILPVEPARRYLICTGGRRFGPARGLRRAVGVPGAAPALLAAAAPRVAGGAPRGRPRLTRAGGPRRSLRGAGRAVPLVEARSLRPESREL
jgi:hypothetical protein